MWSMSLRDTVISLILFLFIFNHVIIIAHLMKTYIQWDSLYFPIFVANFQSLYATAFNVEIVSLS